MKTLIASITSNGSNGISNIDQFRNRLESRLNDPKLFDHLDSKYDFTSLPRFRESFLKGKTETRRQISSLREFMQDNKELSNAINNLVIETIVLTEGRPSILIQDDDFQTPMSSFWENRLNQARNVITGCLDSIGRIELMHHPTYSWVGTGWVVAGTNFLVTNRHVAELFAYQQGPSSLAFRKGLYNRSIRADIDFKVEFESSQQNVFQITGVRYLAGPNAPDVAILEIDNPNNGQSRLPPGIPLQPELKSDMEVFTVGYPAHDSHIHDAQLMEHIFNGIYNVKRLAPGKITGLELNVNQFTHDCTTLGGCSGAPIISLNTGNVVGLHFGGIYRQNNWAVTAGYIHDLLNKI